MTDPAQLRSALMNLVVNARDAMERGGTITISVAEVALDAASLAGNTEAKAGRFVALTVADTGSGVAPEHLVRVFEPFFTTKPSGKGTGLGLAQVFGFVRQSEGHVRIDSVPGSFTRVTIFLPVTGDAAPTRTHAAALRGASREAGPVSVPADGLAQPAGPGKRILVADDETAILHLTRRILGDAGHAVTMAGSGDDAVALIEAGGRFDIILSDIVMPGRVDGTALALHAMARMPDVPIMLMSGYARMADALSPSAARFMPKPFSRAALLGAVAAALRVAAA